jgi:1-acyl-sn-glycerol-3-phosphate acyltransferase
VRFLRSLAAWAVIVASTAVFGIPSIVAAFIPPRGDWYLLFARGWAKVLLAATGIRLSVGGRENLVPPRNCIYFANHESFYDILVLLAVLPGRLRFLAKRSLFHIPVLGWSMAAAGFVPVDRERHQKAVASLDRAAAKLRRGMSVIIFPEQTRTRTGDMLPFKKGGVLLAIKTQLPIVPVGIAGTFPIIQKGSFFLTPGPAAVEIGPPIPTEGRTVADRAQLLAASREAISALREKARAKLAKA